MGPTGPADQADPQPNGDNGQNPRRPSPFRALTRARVGLLLGAIVVAFIVLGRGRLAFLLGILIFIVALLASVMLHELGHFLTAKKFHMRVTQFFVGFGHTLWSTFRGETEYGVKALPFGGFVRISGMTSMEEIDVADEPRSFRTKPGWQRVIVLAAGSFMHFVLAFVLLFLLAIGVGQASTKTSLPGTNVISSITTCVPVSEKAATSATPCSASNPSRSPAEIAGLRTGDEIISVAGRPVGNWNQVKTALTAQRTHVPVPIIVERDGRPLHLTANLAAVPGRSEPYLGVFASAVYVRSGFGSSVAFAGDQFANTLTSSASAIGRLPSAIPDLFSANRSDTAAGQVSSVVGVGQVTGDVVEAALPWQAKVFVVLFIIASLNIFVGAFNLLPLLPLDGGHLAVVIYERLRAWFNRLRGRPDPGLVDIQRLVPVSLLVFAVLVGFSTLIIAADIFNPVHLQV
jgi:membrane-associated protease RseP (regulator of RpoE activity)